MLHSLVLFDMLAVDFSIEGVWLISYGGQQKPLDGAKAIQGVGVQLNQRIVPPDRIHVKVRGGQGEGERVKERGGGEGRVRGGEEGDRVRVKERGGGEGRVRGRE